MTNRIAEIRDRVEKATAGDWYIAGIGGAPENHILIVLHDGGVVAEISKEWVGSEEQRANAALTANAKADLIYLLADNSALRARLAQAEEALRPFADAATLIPDDAEDDLCIAQFDDAVIKCQTGDLRKAAAYFKAGE